MIRSFADVLSTAGTRPGPLDRGKGPYATRFAHAMAVYLANAFRDEFPGVPSAVSAARPVL